VHNKLVSLIADFIAVKQKEGSAVEQRLYTQPGFGVKQMMVRGEESEDCPPLAHPSPHYLAHQRLSFSAGVSTHLPYAWQRDVSLFFSSLHHLA
jgi:hypothetical protein